MPASSRLADLFGTSSPLRWYAPLVAAEVTDDGWQQAWANGMWGGYLTAAADPTYGRVRVDLYWPGVRYATIERVHPDGTTAAVRGGDPATMAIGWARYDYEAPQDQAVYYRATSDERTGSTVYSSGTVTVASATTAWLKHPTRPALNRLITLADFGTRAREARKGALRPPLRKYPVFVHGVRQAETGTFVLHVEGSAELAAIEAMFDDGAELLLQLPTVWGGLSWYISVDTTRDERADSTIGDLIIERIEMPFQVVDRPGGAAAGDPDSSYADVGSTYQTYNQVGNAASTYLDLSMLSL